MLEDLREFGDVEKSPGNLSPCAGRSLVREDANNISLPHFGHEQLAPLEPGGDEASLTITAPGSAYQQASVNSMRRANHPTIQRLLDLPRLARA